MQLPPPVPLALVTTSFDAGGTERQLSELIGRLDPSRWQVHAVCLRAEGPWLERAAAQAASMTEFPVRGFGRPDTWRQAWAFARWCARRRIEIVHSWDLYSNVFALPAAALARVPARIGSRRGLNQDRSAAHLALQRAALRCAHEVVTNSRAVAARLHDDGLDPARVTVIPNGLDIARFAPAPARTTRRRVMAVANLRPEKGLDVLVDAAAVVLREFPEAHFDLIGSGPARAGLERRLGELGIAHAFTFHGRRDDVAAALVEADVFVLPSRTESLPNAVLEAMAAALPVVASAVGGVPDAITDGRTGLLVPAGDAAALSAALIRVMRDATLAASLGRNARAEVQARYSFEQMVSSVERLYERSRARQADARVAVAA